MIFSHHDIFSSCSLLTILFPPRYQVGLDRPFTQTFEDLFTKLPGGSTVLENAYFVIEKTISCVDTYLKEWLDYQSLWNLQPDALFIEFEDDIFKWMHLLSDFKNSRATSNTYETKKEFGPVVIDYAKVQSKVSLKYDSWHKNALGKFGSLLGTAMADFHGNIGKARSELEQQTINVEFTSHAVNFITYVQGLKRKMRGWENQVDVYRESQRFQFPVQWLNVNNIDGRWGDFNRIIQNQVNSLQVEIMAKDKAVEGRTKDYLAEWENNKLVEGALRPDEILQKLAIFKSRLKEERDNVGKSKEALEEAGPSSASEDRMAVGWEVLQDHKSIWFELSRIWELVNEVKDKLWLFDLLLDLLLSMLKDLPTSLQQYASYEYAKKLIQSFQKVNSLIVELNDHDRKTLCKQLRVSWVLSELTLGQVRAGMDDGRFWFGCSLL